MPEVVELKRAGDLDPLYLRALISFEFENDTRNRGDRKVGTRGYTHSISRERDSAELFRWEWHPDIEDAPHAHLHVTSDDDFGAVGVPLRKLHLPSSRVSFEQIVTFAVNDLGAEILDAEAGAQIETAHYLFERWNSWKGDRPPDDQRR